VIYALRCHGVRKSYARTPSLGVKEWFVGARRDSGRFSRKWALNDVSFDVTTGEGFGIIGPNGSGKSTLLGVLLGVLNPEAGHVETRGRVASLLELGAGFHPELTGRQNLYLHGAILGMRIREIRRQFDDVVAFSELGPAIEQPLRTYSSGMIARLGFSAIAHAEADVLLVDEVLAVGDLEFQDKCRRYLQAFKARQGTLIFVSHDLSAVRAICERGIWLDQGQIRATGTIHDVVGAYQRSTHVAMGPQGAAAPFQP
jgi:homopolymeric O-antigen transport system ATP-binding protein